mmetsp:Transcript_1908/g.2461  ORF Transcript_1908/g.2461 Transcript_1908/m.2461 type:complete len:97 (-) Transcript_1908:1582-1872(-)
MATGRANVNVSLSRNWDHLQNKYVGTGHPDTTKYEWAVNHHRDSLASHIGHYDLLSYFAVAENESVGRVRTEMIEKMVQPCGPPPAQQTENGDIAD